MSQFAGGSFLVTGASSGIGRAVTQGLLRSGAFVYGVARTEDRLKGFDDAEGRLTPVALDLLETSGFSRFVEHLPVLDGVVHSAGVVDVRPLAFFSLERYRKVMDTNLTAPLAMTAALLKARRLSPGASVIFISSINGNQKAVMGCAAYAASKAGLVGAAKVMALELAPQRIRVNCVLPGAVEGPMTASLGHVSEESLAAEKRCYPLGHRFAHPDEIASSVLYLLSDDAGFITGQCLTVDGGCSVR